jgi:hypothetical protein
VEQIQPAPAGGGFFVGGDYIKFHFGWTKVGVLIDKREEAATAFFPATIPLPDHLFHELFFPFDPYQKATDRIRKIVAAVRMV